MSEVIQREKSASNSIAQAAGRDIVMGGIMEAAIVLFAGTGSSAMINAFRTLLGQNGHSDNVLVVTLLLNVALILFGWRRYIDLQKEVEERTAAEERAQILAMRDPLTGFHNRRSLAEQGSEMLARAGKRGKQLAMLMLDLDHFKNVNDIHGHAVGDGLLRAVAAEITKLMPPNALAARLGGDEFAVAFVFDVANPDVVDRIAEAMVSRLAV